MKLPRVSLQRVLKTSQQNFLTLLSVFSLGSLSIILELLLQQSDTVSVLVVVSYSFPAANPTLPQRGPLPSPIPQSPLGEGLAKPVFASLECTELLCRSLALGPSPGRAELEAVGAKCLADSLLAGEAA